ncbi:hypothetical protein ACFQ2M_34740 [Kitasatospora saccharophila]|uniref:hypothetical protein n=1 Tax=Kitasatospora saccharophila TaxID=407973 RepID=UPI00363E0C6F
MSARILRCPAVRCPAPARAVVHAPATGVRPGGRPGRRPSGGDALPRLGVLLSGAVLFTVSGLLAASGAVHRGPGEWLGPRGWAGVGLGYLVLWPVLYAAQGPGGGRPALPFAAVCAGGAACVLLGAGLGLGLTGS